MLSNLSWNCDLIYLETLKVEKYNVDAAIDALANNFTDALANKLDVSITNRLSI